MTPTHEDYVGLYGNVRIPKAYCEPCGRYAFVLDGALACCGAPHRPEPVFWKRESAPPNEKKNPSLADQKLILETQNYSCFWCDRRFGLNVWFGKSTRVLRTHWDHMVPWAYDQNNSLMNFVAACNVCNLWKASLIFQTIEQCRIYLKGKWDEAQNRTEDLPEPELPSRIYSAPRMAEFLLPKVPVAGVGPEEPPCQTRRPGYKASRVIHSGLTVKPTHRSATPVSPGDQKYPDQCPNPTCVKRFKRRRPNQKYCSPSCGSKVYYQRKLVSKAIGRETSEILPI